MTAWSEFEQLAAKIYNELAPASLVKHNDIITGKSGVPRQIDVSVRTKIAGHDILMVIDTKDYKSPADIGEVDEFAGKLEDVSANRGILICRSGFTSGARKRASIAGIDLCNLHDAQSRDWSLDVELPMLWIELYPNVQVTMEPFMEGGDQLQLDPTLWVITADGGDTRLKLLATFERIWNERKISTTVGPKHAVKCAQGPLQIQVKDKEGNVVWRTVYDLKFVYFVYQKTWRGTFTPEECRGVLHYSDDHFEPSYLPLGTIPTKRDQSWDEVEDAELLSVLLPGTVITTAMPTFTANFDGLSEVQLIQAMDLDAECGESSPEG